MQPECLSTEDMLSAIDEENNYAGRSLHQVVFSLDVTALYPSVPQGEAIDIFHEMMINDDDLESKTKMTAENIIALFKICVQTTYFVFNKKLYKQVDGLAIGASSSGPAAELFI